VNPTPVSTSTLSSVAIATHGGALTPGVGARLVRLTQPVETCIPASKVTGVVVGAAALRVDDRVGDSDGLGDRVAQRSRLDESPRQGSGAGQRRAQFGWGHAPATSGEKNPAHGVVARGGKPWPGTGQRRPGGAIGSEVARLRDQRHRMPWAGGQGLDQDLFHGGEVAGGGPDRQHGNPSRRPRTHDAHRQLGQEHHAAADTHLLPTLEAPAGRRRLGEPDGIREQQGTGGYEGQQPRPIVRREVFDEQIERGREDGRDPCRARLTGHHGFGQRRNGGRYGGHAHLLRRCSPGRQPRRYAGAGS
jgi:hypothetical protein